LRRGESRPEATPSLFFPDDLPGHSYTLDVTCVPEGGERHDAYTHTVATTSSAASALKSGWFPPRSFRRGKKKNERGRALSTHGRIHRRRRSEKKRNKHQPHPFNQ
jgi:hypothetical protein